MSTNSEVNKELIETYKEHVKKFGLKDELYKWEMIGKFQGQPKLDSQDFSASVSAVGYGNLIYPVSLSVIKHIADVKPMEYRDVLSNLFNPNVELNDRIVNYIQDSEDLYLQVRTGPEKNHFQDERTIASILAFYDPSKYALFKDSFYQKYCKKLGIRPKGKHKKYSHYLELLKDLKVDISEDVELQKIISTLIPEGYYRDENLNLLAQDILYQTLDVLSNQNEEPITSVENEIKNKVKVNPHINMNPLNQILFGPPGTGKTYNTINKALEILGEYEYLKKGDRKAIKGRYDDFVKSGQIVFTTFHQSMSYEDFIEGIKPVTTEIGNIIYEVEDGIFKNISRIAEESINIKKSTGFSNLVIDEKLLMNSNFFKVSLGDSQTDDAEEIYDWCIENNRIATGWGGEIDFSKARSESDIKTILLSKDIAIKNSNDYNLVAMKCLKLSMKPGDIVFVSNGNRKLKAVAKIIGDYEFMPNAGTAFKQTREVEWLFKDLNIPVVEVYESFFSQASIYQLSKKKVKLDYFKESKKTNTSTNPYILIIDEINRGNVSQIFGELITLIEEDKRIGNSEELRIKLPYSKDKELFGVPPNLYIIGTMNTADRSVEALDNALRRRFVFEEMNPDFEILNPYNRLGKLWADHWKEEPESNRVYWNNWESLESKVCNLPKFSIDREKYIALIRSLKPKDHETWVSIKNYEDIFKDMIIEGQGGIRLDKMLEKMNLRIEKLLGKDYQIGHAFFVNIYTLDELRNVFLQKIIPLLQEYFYGDIGKIALVIGDTFMEKVSTEKVLFNSSIYHDQGVISDMESKVNYTFSKKDSWTENSFIAIYN